MLLTGEFNNTLDEKGRVSLPAKFRKELDGNLLFLTQGQDKCLWLYTPQEWDKFRRKVMETTNPFDAHSRAIRRRIIGPAQEVEIDRAGRIAIPQRLREFSSLAKDCVILGQDDYIELWDAEVYRNYLQGSEADFEAASEELGAIFRKEREETGKER
jgi:MraZ protein